MLLHVDATGAVQGGAGIVTYVLGLVKGWRDAGFDDEWILEGTSDLSEGIADRLGDMGTVHLTGSSGPLARIAVQQTVLPLRMLRCRPDVLLCTTPVVPRVTLGIPVVAVVHDLRHIFRPEDFSSSQNWYRRQSWESGLRRSARLIADSDRTRDDLRSHYPFTSPKTRTIYLGSDHVPETKPGTENGHGIAFARWANKRPDFAIRSWAALKNLQPGLNRRLHVVGVGAGDEPRITSLARELGIADLVVVQPFLAEADYWQLFASAGVVLFPSSFEGFGLPVLEAMRLRVPVVTWRDPAVVEVAGDCAWYSNLTPEEFGNQVAAAFDDSPGTRLRVERAFDRATLWTWRKTAENTREVLVEARQG